MKARLPLLLTLLAQVPLLAGAQETNSQVLDKIWIAGRQKACSPEMRAGFDERTLTRLKGKLRSESDRSSLAEVVNPFLFSQGYSHTQLFTDRMESFYLFKGYQSQIDPKAPPAPLLVNPGIQVGTDHRGYFVREVLDGLPAKGKNIERGDRILAVDGTPFAGDWGKTRTNATVRFSHRGHLKEIALDLPALNWSQAFQDATLKSIRVIPLQGKSIGYVHLWSGVHPESANALWSAVREFRQANVDGIVLDLRGGYGGAFWEHLDPFFSDRKDYFEMSATNGDGKTDVLRPPPKKNEEAYLGPMSVVIDESSRSGKEALAYQFKKSRRAVVVGTTTAGYFSGGELIFIDEPVDYLLYLCVMRDSKLDGTEVEGIGISPTLSVAFAPGGPFSDSQLEAALNQIAK